MVAAVDRLGPWLLDLGVVAWGWFCLVMLSMVACRQPIRRRDLARVGIVGALVLIPLSVVPSGRFELELDTSTLLPPALTGVVERVTGTIPGRIGHWLTIGYLAGAGMGLCWSMLGTWAMHRLVTTATPASDSSRRLCLELPFDGRRRPGLGVSDRVRRPVLVGGRRPMIVIPTDWDREDVEGVERLRLGMLHELAHAERRDPVFHWLAGLAQAIWFPIPPAWWLRRQLRVDQEFLADNRASGRFGEASSTYAASLIETAAGRRGLARRVSPGAEVGSAVDPDGSTLLQRVAMLLHCPFPVETNAPTGWRLGIPLASAVMVVLLSRFSVDWVPDGPASGVSEPVPIAFDLSELSISPAPVDRPLRLPVRLPEHFELSLDLYANPRILGEITVAGVRLDTAGSNPGRLRPGQDSWHRVRIEVDRGDARLWIDGRARPTPRPPESELRWLTVRPAAGRPIRIRDLKVNPVDSRAEATASSQVSSAEAAS